MLDAAITETDQILQAFGALLRLARIEAQAPPGQDARVDLDRLVDDAAELYAPIAAERHIELAVSISPAQTQGDADQLFQLLVNLLDNAIKFAPSGSTVEVSLRRTGQGIELDVSDRGSGIPEPDRERVFDRFERLESHRASPGSGLGLSLARAIVLRHEGRIALLDNAPGLRVRVIFRST
jgi:signal transduction histidine kinase